MRLVLEYWSNINFYIKLILFLEYWILFTQIYFKSIVYCVLWCWKIGLFLMKMFIDGRAQRERQLYSNKKRSFSAEYNIHTIFSSNDFVKILKISIIQNHKNHMIHLFIFFLKNDQNEFLTFCLTADSKCFVLPVLN